MKEIEKSALLEIGTEEIPASYCALALDFMRTYAEEYLRSMRLSYKEIQVLGTPRRLSLIVQGFPMRSEVQEEESWGPPQAKAKSVEGEWTPAALGFAKSQGTAVENLSVRLKKDIPYLCFVKKKTGQPCEKILKDLFTSVIESIPFPKKMIWDDSCVRFARPIRNLVAILDKQILRLSIGKIRSSNKTFGLSHLSSKAILISSPQTYLATLKNHCILVDPSARKATILKASSQLAEKVGGKLKCDESLLDEVTFLVEHPVATLCHFDPKFLELPSEVLTTCMRKQQKFFSILDGKGQLTSHFIAIRNGVSEHQEMVRKGYEKVLTARLTDAQFFLAEDLKKPLEHYRDKCKGIVLQEKLGSIDDKILRMISIALNTLELISPRDGLPDPIYLKSTIGISKFDLATQMVCEFPELQGIMGDYYARQYGKDKEMSSAIREHYYPITVQGELPTSVLSSLVALTDKLDYLLGSFLIGNVPTGSSDPYGLRRHSSGILRILLHRQWEFPLSVCINRSLTHFSISRAHVQKEILEFLLERFHLLMQDLGYSLDEIYAVTKNSDQKDVENLNVIPLWRKIIALDSIRSHPDFEAITASFKRISNILKQAKAKNISYSPEKFDKNLLKEQEEFDLDGEIRVSGDRAKKLIFENKYKEALLEFVNFRTVLDLFFEKVMVMAEDPQICSNRLSLLSLLETLFKEVADFSYLQNKSNS